MYYSCSQFENNNKITLLKSTKTLKCNIKYSQVFKERIIYCKYHIKIKYRNNIHFQCSIAVIHILTVRKLSFNQAP